MDGQGISLGSVVYMKVSYPKKILPLSCDHTTSFPHFRCIVVFKELEDTYAALALDDSLNVPKVWDCMPSVLRSPMSLISSSLI